MDGKAEPLTTAQLTSNTSREGKISTPQKKKRFTPPPHSDLIVPEPVIIDPPDIPLLRTAPILDLKWSIWRVETAFVNVRHVHKLGTDANGLLTASGQGYLFQEGHSSHVFEWSRGEFVLDFEPGNAVCLIIVMRHSHKDVIKFKAKTSDWLALQTNLWHRRLREATN